MAERSLFCAKVKGTGYRYEGSSYKINVLNMVDVYEIKGSDKIPLCSELTVRCSENLCRAIREAAEANLEEFYFTAQWETQTMSYIGTVITAPLKKLTKLKPYNY